MQAKTSVALSRLLRPHLGAYDVFHQSEQFKRADGNPCDIEFPPFMTVGGGALIGVVVVVPAFAIGPESDEPIVAAVVVGLVVFVAPDVCHRVDAPGDVPGENGANENPPDQHAQAKLSSRYHGLAHR